ncbi:FtsX-like permease family protein [Balneola sp. MJW-20]|uniref:FtsX-like permease family protein n=1 Tax=Gracilimonas aurantiaca TaxID=3234185 RepID=UPI00346502D5
MDTTGFIARRYLFSRKHISLISTLTFISITGITIGTALLIVVLSVFNGFFSVIKGFLLSYDPDIRIESSGSPTFSQNEEVMARLREVPEIRVISPFIEDKALMAIGEDNSAVVDVKGIEKDLFFQLSDVEKTVTDGVFALGVQNRVPGVMVHDALMDQLELEVDDEVALLSAAAMKNALTQISSPRVTTFDVRGSYFIQQVAGSPKVFVELKAAQRLFRLRNEISGYDIKLTDNQLANTVKDRLQAELGSDYKISTWYDLQKPLYDVMYLEKWASYVILMIIVIVAVLNIIGSLTMIVIQKQRDIGILISMGYTRKRIRSIFRKQGLYIGLIGCFIGGALGLFLAWAQQTYGLVKLSNAFVIDSYPVDIQMLDVIVILAGSLILSILASWYPAYRASLVNPADAVRYE